MLGQSVSFGDVDRFVVVFGVSPCMASCVSEMRKNFNSTDEHDDDSEDHPAKFQEICEYVTLCLLRLNWLLVKEGFEMHCMIIGVERPFSM